MASLDVPSASSPAISPKTSTLPLRPRIIPHENSLGPVGHTRRASQEDVKSPNPESAVSPLTILPSGLELPRTKAQDTSPSSMHEHAERTSGKSELLQETDEAVDRHNVTLVAVDELELPHADGRLPAQHAHHHGHLGAQPVKTIYAGPPGNQRKLDIPTGLLEANSGYFQRVLEHDPDMDHMVFEDADPIAMGMLMRWLVVRNLEKPDSFHSLTHWFALYVITVRFEMEELRNHCK